MGRVALPPAPPGGLPAPEPGSPAGESPGATKCSPTRAEYVEQTPRRPRRTPTEIAAEAALGHHWVTLLSIERAVPRDFGDNRGMRPVWVEANADWRQSGVVFDRQQPAMRAVRLAVLGVPSAAHAARLKAALDEALHGRVAASGAAGLRHRFRDAIELGEVDVWWTPVLAEAIMTCELAARDFEVFTRADHERMVARRVRGIGRAEATG